MGEPPLLSAQDRKSKIWSVIRVSSGNFLEMYDFMVFGYYAAAIGSAFFPSGNAFTSLMLSLMTFGAGFLMRPLGAIVLGAYTDLHGRRTGLILTLSLMSVGIISIACMPGYDTIGLLAPLLVLVGRLLQGFSAGMELGGVSVYLSEIATPGHKGFYVSWQSASQQVAVMFAAALGVVLSSILPPQKMTLWGWRIPLLLGCMIIPFLFRLRRSLQETSEFAARKHRPTISESLHSLTASWRIVILGTMLATMTTAVLIILASTFQFAFVAQGIRHSIESLCHRAKIPSRLRQVARLGISCEAFVQFTETVPSPGLALFGLCE
jgi:MFS family permease